MNWMLSVGVFLALAAVLSLGVGLFFTRRRPDARKGTMALAAVVAGLFSAASYGAVTSGDEMVLAALKTRLPKTVVSKIDCKMGSLCEIVAGNNLFYVDRTARYLVVGRVYDMETRQDVTAARMLELDPDRMVGGAVAAQRKADAGEARKVDADYPIKPAAQAGQGGDHRVSLSALPKDGAIVWGKGGPTVTIFTDFRCSYCRALANALDQMNVRVIERPISVLGSREIANRAYCSKDQRRAVKDAYAGETLPEAKCDTSGLDANERFARAQGFTGTPVIVRADGAVIEGYRPREFLETWLKGAKS
jgi:thiol:disulfide interchange protein DsbC